MRMLFYIIKYNEKCRYHCITSSTVDCTQGVKNLWGYKATLPWFYDVVFD